MDRISDITINFDGEVLKFQNVTKIYEDDTSVKFTDKNEHEHTFHRVSYHIESYYPPLPEKDLPSDVL